MSCSTIQSTTVPGDDPCTGSATHMLLTDELGPDKALEPVCKPCGESYTRRPALKARLVPLHVHQWLPEFLEIIEGHRLIEDAESEARCFDCGTRNRLNWFRFQTNGCPARPESIEVMRHSRNMLQAEESVRAAMSARVWWSYAVEFVGVPVGDWRVVTDDPHYSAFFTFRDREYGLRHDLPAGRFGAEKLPNRGRPEPKIGNRELDDTYKQVVFYFHDRITDSGSSFFATWTPSHADVTARELVILYSPEGRISEVLRIPGLHTFPETTAAICDAFGPISDVLLKDRIYE
ncbi:hypothetical protein ACFVXC_05500 [Streptomyces sp. NPDC058257]|uniref:hypothetical protein n=1 Tax=Streptomyces sp. NPDC058257 TaxID=3346409 RepID=UPI0036E6B49D